MWMLCAVLGALSAYASAHAMGPDGVSYLDLAHAWRHGDWGHAVNAYWSPGYAWLIAVALWLFRPSPLHEFYVVHAVNFAIFLGSLGAFAYFLRGVIVLRRRYTGARDREALLIVAAYTAFAWTSLALATPSEVTPDLLLSVFTFLAGGQIARLGVTARPRQLCVTLGITLAAGYMTKSAMFLLAFAYLGGATLALGRGRRRIAAVAVLAYVAACVPWLTAVSVAHGSPTFGDTGSLNYAWFVDRAPYPVGFSSPSSLRPSHPPAVVWRSPDTYSFSRHSVGTSPLWTDPPYWYAGVAGRFDAARQVTALRENLNVYLDIARSPVGVLVLLSIGGAAFFGRRNGVVARGLSVYAPLLVPAVSTLVVYALVTTTERYVAAALAVGLVSIVFVLLPAGRSTPGLAASACIACASIAMLAQPARLVTRAAWGAAVDRSYTGGTYTKVASGLVRAGIPPGSLIATMGENGGTERGIASMRAPWALLAQVKIVADITQPRAFWSSPPTARLSLEKRLQAQGARAIVAEYSQRPVPAGWRLLSGTGYIVKPLGQQSIGLPSA